MTRHYTRTIGPEEAKKLLSNLYHKQRPVRMQPVRDLAFAMSNGKFNSQNGESIKISKDGELIDGQHRLNAVIESGVRIEFDFAVVDDAESAYMTIDNGSRRSTSDYLDGKYKNEVAALAKVAYALEFGDAPLLSALQGKLAAKLLVPREESVNYANEHHEKLQRLAQLGARVRRINGGGSGTSYAIAFLLIDMLGDPSRIEGFVKDFDERFENGNKTLILFNNTVLKVRGDKTKKQDKQWYIGTTLQAYEAYLNGIELCRFGKHKAYLNKYSSMLDEWRTLLAACEEVA